jgi:DNA polymerase-1
VVDGAGRICFRTTDEEGEPHDEPLANFAAVILEDVILDDGAETSRTFLINGRLEGGAKLPPIEVPAADFESLKWVATGWGARPRIYARENYRGMVREAIQALSEPVERRIFAHSGWRNVDGQMIYLHAGGGVGANGHVAVSVKLHDAIANIRLPTEPEDVRGAIAASLSLLDVAPLSVMVPLLGAVYAAPLASITKPNMMVHLVGETGSRKSSMAALMMQHFGAAFGSTTGASTSLPLHWLSTFAAIENAQFQAKDALLVLDDYKHQGDPSLQRRLEAKAADVIRAIGDRTAKQRSSWQGGGRPMVTLTPHPPRGLTLSTGEIVPRGHSDVGRLVLVPLEKRDVDLDKLSAAQKTSGRLSHAMRGYIQWCAQRYDALVEVLPELHASLAAELRQATANAEAHTRHPGALAHLLVGLVLFTRLAEDVGAVDAARGDRLRAEAKAALLDLALAQREAVEEADPVMQFVTTLQALIATRKATLRPKAGNVEPGYFDGEIIGWKDAEHAYLLHEVALRLVAQCMREGGAGPFPLGPRALAKALVERGVASPKKEGDRLRYVRNEWCEGATHRVVVMPLDRLINATPPADANGVTPEVRSLFDYAAVAK